MEMIFCLLVTFVVSMYWLSKSLVIQLFSMASYVVINSVLVYCVSNMIMISYLMLFSVISGLVVVLSFVMMSESNSESSSVYNKDEFLIFAPMILFVLLLTPTEISMQWPEALVNQLSFFSGFLSNLYLMMFVFMALVLLMMLFVVDYILTSHGGSMLPMK